MTVDPLKSTCEPFELVEKLQPYIGGKFQLWHFTSSHCMLTLRVFKKGQKDKYITFNFVDRIESDTMTDIANPKVKTGNGKYSVLIDGSLKIKFEYCIFSDEEFKIA